MPDLTAVVQRMIDAGESEENIATVIRAQKPDTSHVSVVSPDEPGTFLGGVDKSLHEMGRSMFEHAARPQTAGDVVGLLVPTGAAGAVAGATEFGERSMGALKAAGRETEGLRGMTTFPMRAVSKFNEALPSRIAEDIAKFRGTPLRPVATQPTIMPNPVTEKPLPTEMPPAAPETFSAAERAGLKSQHYTPQVLAQIDARLAMKPMPSHATVPELMPSHEPLPVNVADVPVLQRIERQSPSSQASSLQRIEPVAEPVAATPSVKSAADWAQEMADLRTVKPRPIDKLYGKTGPTPEQATEHAQQMREWNRKFSAASKQQKIALERDNAAFYARQAQEESPLRQPRMDVGAEKVGRGVGQTKEQIRQQTGPVLDEQLGDASPILPEKALQKIIDTMRELPKGGPEREAYVARATSGKAKAQVENIRRTLEHLGLLVPAAVSAREAMAGMLRDEQ